MSADDTRKTSDFLSTDATAGTVPPRGLGPPDIHDAQRHDWRRVAC